jgi:hypothetical protein
LKLVHFPAHSPLPIAALRLDRYPRGFTGHVAHPSRSIPSIATCSMSLIPSAPLISRYI